MLDAADLRDWLVDARDVLSAHRVDLNRLNVFPWPDQDTGTNMVTTMAAAAEAAGTGALGCDGALGELSTRVAKALWNHSRGTSGQILARILTAFFEALPATGPVGPSELRVALDAAAAAAPRMRNAVEGTMVTVMAAVAPMVAALDGGASLGEVAAAGRDAAGKAVVRTTTQLPKLASLGIVDAGALGLQFVLDALFDRCR